ncbi:uncharacterized protein LOC126988875 [Eriocheir sinensis]|uniref:uncharacterized protein LOC126988875 n=1 Tax=Eriocheir sinensis TaxID=95602 RepID=UPI0021CA356F|nr:uncharacterized protein LOC126988875 [Eriocheir sinensis]
MRPDARRSRDVVPARAPPAPPPGTEETFPYRSGPSQVTPHADPVDSADLRQTAAELDSTAKSAMESSSDEDFVPDFEDYDSDDDLSEESEDDEEITCPEKPGLCSMKHFNEWHDQEGVP